MNLHIEGLDPVHFLLAYAGMLISLLGRLAKVFNRPEFTAKIFFRTNIIPTLISIIGIPVLLIIATDPIVKSTLPINYLTAMLVGLQTQSFFKTLFSIYGGSKKNIATTQQNNGQTNDSNTPSI